ncbi:MAG: N-acetylmuramoyl-L-alanine amidase [Clostridia bacterium]|nr:N-acetylmuramoyl-L-alanine amidase [Clostridia bacterium]
MAYSNSPLASYTRLTSHRNSPRNHAIDRITIHCMAGQMTGKACADYFATTSRQVSSNYCVGYDGSIALSVEEKNRSWCSSSPSNDHRAITIEVATDSTYPYKCTDKAYAALLDLCTDICRRNGIKKLNYTGDLKGNMTKHKWFAATACPGEYLESKFTAIQNEVNRRLAGDVTAKGNASNGLYRVQVGAYLKKANAAAMEQKVKAAGFQAFIRQEGIMYKVQTGAYREKANAEAQAKKLQAAGYRAIVKAEGPDVAAAEN